MKRRVSLFLAAALAACAAQGGEVGADEAEAAALAFAQQNAILRDHVLGVGEARRHGAGIWVVPLRPAGYIALEADDARFPVVAFSEENDFPATDLPEALDAALWRMPQPSPLLRAFSLAPEAPRHPAWAALLAPQGGVSLLAFTPDEDIETAGGAWDTINTFTTQWNQCLPWNLYAPGLDAAIVGEGGRPLLGDYGTRCAIGFASWPAPLGMTTGFSPAAFAASPITSMMRASHETEPLFIMLTISNLTVSMPSAISRISFISSSVLALSMWRISKVHSTLPGMTFSEPGQHFIVPAVRTSLSSIARQRLSDSAISRAIATIASRRFFIMSSPRGCCGLSR